MASKTDGELDESASKGDAKGGESERKTLSTSELREKLKMVDVKSPSPTTLLARNTVLLPTGVARVKQQARSSKPTAEEKSPTASSSGSATGNPRNKTALTPGHSLMDWIRLGNSGVDLTGVGGVPRVVSLSELANHDKQTDAWIAIRGIVFNVTRYMDFHPGGVDELMRGVGKDATKLFENVHAWVNYQSILQKCVVGRLSRSSSVSTSSSTADRAPANPANRTALRLIRSCTQPRDTDEENSVPGLRDVTIDWRQTSSSVTLLCKGARDYPGIYYRLTRLGDSKLVFRLSLEREVIVHELELAAGVEWPPTWRRNFDTNEVDFTFPKKTSETWKSRGSYTSSREPCAEQRAYKKYEVVGNTPLCSVVHLLVLRARDSLELIPVGRHVEVKMNVMGMEVSRSYTPVPSCLHPDDLAPSYEPDCICLMIKRYPDGALSPSLTALQPGQTIALSNALGAFAVEPYDRYSVVHMLAAGTGLTVMLGIIQRSLARRGVKLINLVHFNRDEENMFYVAQLDRVAVENRLKVTHVLSQPKDSWTGRRGTVSDELLKELVGVSCAEACVFTCGPSGFMQSTRKCLQTLDWKSCQIHEFDD